MSKQESKNTQTVVVPKAFKLRDESGVEYPYAQGIAEMPPAHVEHWYAKAHGVVPYDANKHAPAADVDVDAFEKEKADFEAAKVAHAKEVESLTKAKTSFEKEKADFEAAKKSAEVKK